MLKRIGKTISMTQLVKRFPPRRTTSRGSRTQSGAGNMPARVATAWANCPDRKASPPTVGIRAATSTSLTRPKRNGHVGPANWRKRISHEELIV